MILAILGPGEVFGEMSLLNGGPRTATVTAVRATTLLELTGSAFERELERSPALAAELMRELAVRIRSSSKTVSELVHSDVPSRVARALVMLAEKFAVRTETGQVRVAHELTQSELAELVGSARETVNKALALLERSGLIETGMRSVTVTNYQGLCTYAGVEPSRV